MPSLPSEPEDHLSEWNQALFAHFFYSPKTQPPPLNRLHVTADELCAASSGRIRSSMEARRQFIEVLRTAIGRRSLGRDAQIRASHWNIRAEETPPFLSHLLLTCLVANDVAEEVKSIGDFRKRLTQILKGRVSHGLSRMRPLWELLARWLLHRQEHNQHVVSLKLPSIPISGHHSIIGYPLRLSVPTRRDQNVLADLIARNDLAGHEPPIRELVVLIQKRSNKFSPLFREMFREFTDAMKNLSRTLLAQTTFWAVIREIAFATPTLAQKNASGFKMRVEMEDDDGHFWLYLTSDRIIKLKGYQFEALPTVRTSLYLYGLRSERGGANVVDQAFLDKTSTSGIEGILKPLRSAVAEGIVLFVENEDNVSIFVPTVPSSGRLCAIVSDRISHQLSIAFSNSQIRARITNSRYPGWFEWREFTAEDLQELDFSKLNLLSNLRSLRQSLPLAQIYVRGGVRPGADYVCVHGALPWIEVHGADQVVLHLQGGHVLNLVASKLEPKRWTFPGDTDHSQLIGQHRFIAYLSKIQIAEKIVNYVGDVFEAKYKRPSTNGRWLTEGGSADVLIFKDEEMLVPWRLNKQPKFKFVQNIKPSTVATRNNPTLCAAITKVAAALVSQRGISEGELAVVLKETFEIPWADVWPLLRAWVEVGVLDCLIDLRWRARLYFAREPELVVYQDGETLTGVLAGLVPVSLSYRFNQVARLLGLELAEIGSSSLSVPPLPRCHAKSVGQLQNLARELELAELRWLCNPAEVASCITKVMNSRAPEPQHWPVYKRWDWQELAFRESPAISSLKKVSLEWCRRDDGPDCYKLYEDATLVWWTRSRTWAILSAMAAAGIPAFQLTSRGKILCVGSGSYLPLPLARIAAVVGTISPSASQRGKTQPGYEYSLSSEQTRASIFDALYYADGRQIENSTINLRKLLRACTKTPGPSIPVPAALRGWLNKFSDPKRSTAVLNIPLSLLPIFYAYQRAFAKASR
jgi:hypothetical protein